MGSRQVHREAYSALGHDLQNVSCHLFQAQATPRASHRISGALPLPIQPSKAPIALKPSQNLIIDLPIQKSLLNLIQDTPPLPPVCKYLHHAKNNNSARWDCRNPDPAPTHYTSWHFGTGSSPKAPQD